MQRTLLGETNKDRKVKMIKTTQKSFGKQITIFHRNDPAIVPYDRYYANDTTPYVPEHWAQEAVEILYEKMVFASTVHREFEDEIAAFGDTVHTRKDAELIGKRKQNDLDDVEEQDVSSENIDVVLNQRIYVTFLLGDRERSMSFKNLVDRFLVNAIQAQTRLIDQSIGLQAYQFLNNVSGGLDQLSKTNAHDELLNMREVFNDNKTPLENRWLALASRSETNMQKADIFKKANEVGDQGTALRKALLGEVAGWNTFLELNTPSVRNATTRATTTTSAAAIAGATTIDVAAVTDINAGDYITVAGDMTPLRVNSISTLELTLNRPLKYNIASGAVVTPYESALVNQGSAILKGDKNPAVSDGYPQHWQKGITFDGTGVPKVGQLVSFSTSGGTVLSQEYGIAQVNGTSILLDRPLEASIDDNAVIHLGPSGDYNFAYQRNALAVVNRPMILPPEGSGARAALGQAHDLALRVTMAWDSKKEAMRVTVSGLFGVAKLDDARGGVLLG